MTSILTNRLSYLLTQNIIWNWSTRFPLTIYKLLKVSFQKRKPKFTSHQGTESFIIDLDLMYYKV